MGDIGCGGHPPPARAGEWPGLPPLPLRCAGFWLNRTAWRHRRLMWQLQAAVVAGGVGFVAGRLTAGKHSDD